LRGAAVAVEQRVAAARAASGDGVAVPGLGDDVGSEGEAALIRDPRAMAQLMQQVRQCMIANAGSFKIDPSTLTPGQ
jgi:hypothetical protein